MNSPLHAGITSCQNSLFCMNHEYTSSCEKKWTLAPDEGAGSVRWIFIRKGLTLVVQDYELALPVCTTVNRDNLPVKFNFCLSGFLNGEIDSLNREITVVSSECSMLSTCGRFRGCMQRQATEPVKMLTVFFDHDLLGAYLGQDIMSLPDEVRSIIEKRCSSEIKRTISTEIQMVLNDIFAIKKDGGLSRMRIEAKLLELISVYMHDLIKGNTSSLMHDSDAERAALARDILIREMENPPDLSKLAGMVGVSHTKLIHSFRTIYGTTPFKYLRDIRLEKSRELLESGKMNVTEAAYTIGYNNMSFFAKAFREKYGISPSQCQIKN